MTDKPTPTDEVIDAVTLEVLGYAALDKDTNETARLIARAVLAKWGQPAVKGEPVAWLSPWRKDQVTTDYDAYGKQGIPLYMAPQPVAREPLTPERVKEIALGAGYDQCGIPDTERAAFINGLRHGEQAHGIKGGQHVS